MPEVLTIEENKCLQKLHQKLNTPNPNSNLSPSRSLRLRLRINHYFAQRERKCYLHQVLGLIQNSDAISDHGESISYQFHLDFN
jgi:hypothetical protein